MKVGANKKKCPDCGNNSLDRIISNPIYHDTHSPMHPRRGRGVGGYGRVDPGEGFQGMGKNLG